ncbi:MAG: hypothetical protein WCE70_01865 [Rhodanobacteraceae bacterium]
MPAGSNPSRSYGGSGEALGWLFPMQSVDQVDEIRISAGDDSTRGTQVLATYPVEIFASEDAPSERSRPAWVTALSALDGNAQRDAYEKAMNTPATPGEVALFGVFMLLVGAIGLGAFAAPAWALWRWRAGWRVAAAVPAALLTFVVLRIVVETGTDPTSHNLWPFEVLQSGALALVVMACLFAARKIVGVGR